MDGDWGVDGTGHGGPAASGAVPFFFFCWVWVLCFVAGKAIEEMHARRARSCDRGSAGPAGPRTTATTGGGRAAMRVIRGGSMLRVPRLFT